MKIVQARDKIQQIIDLITVVSISNEWSVDKEKPMAVIVDFVIPALQEIIDGLGDGTMNMQIRTDSL